MCALEYDVVACMKVWVGVSVGATEDIVSLRAKMLRIGGVEAMSRSDSEYGGGDNA